jgi:glucose/mannose-6-phosphate isomerase
MRESSLKSIDRSNMYDKIVSFPQQLVEGIRIGKNADLKGLTDHKYNNIVLAGMGGSAIAGDLVKSVLLDELKVSLTVNRNYGLPSFIDGDSLVICSSYSGNTEETLSAFDEAVKRGCQILCLSTGGELAAGAERTDAAQVKIPTDYMPREALGYSFSPLLIILGRLGFCRDFAEELRSCSAKLEEWKKQYLFDAENNISAVLADKLAGKIAIIYSDSVKLNSAALRFKGQICENAKQLAFCNVFPEFNHNELVGWEISSREADRFMVVFLRDRNDQPQITRRIDTVRDIIAKKKVEVVELYARGDNPLQRVFSIVQLVDFTSYYLALKNGVDPTPIRLIDYLKESLIGKAKEEQ